MIEITTKTVDGVNFIFDFKIVEPRDKEYGLSIEYVDWRCEKEVKPILYALGLRRIGERLERAVSIYAFYPWGYFQYKLIIGLARIYWRVIAWLYDNARLFKQIPEYERFSWKYFTPYTWLKR